MRLRGAPCLVLQRGGKTSWVREGWKRVPWSDSWSFLSLENRVQPGKCDRSELPRDGGSMLLLRPRRSCVVGLYKWCFSTISFTRCLRLTNWEVPVLSTRKLLVRTSEKALFLNTRLHARFKNAYSSSSCGWFSHTIVVCFPSCV